MRLLHVVPTYLPATRYGGPIVAVHGLCRALARRGHEVHVFTTNVDGSGVSAVPLDCPVEMDGVRVHYFAARLRRLYYSPAMRRSLRTFVPLCDVVHVHSVFLWPTSAAARVAARAGVPYAVSPRGMLVPELIRRKSRVAKSMWIGLVERQTLAEASGVHFTSQREFDDARLLRLPLPSPFVVPNGIDLPPLSGEPRDPRLLLFLGRVNWKKGLDRLIDAVRGLDARLVIAGNDEENYAATLPRAENVELVGTVTGDAKEALLRRAAALVLPSLSENFGNVVLEAMAQATPVVVTPQVGLAADVAAAGAGIVTAPESLAAALEALLADPVRGEEMGRRGRALVEARFSWDRVAAEMEEHYACSMTSRRSS
ncbi:MAG TPA: glycosyltransferase [Thermoanaerobaculia bacterium]|nr:glycosyltransferase [Thermoanaerobaculia bacterium]